MPFTEITEKASAYATLIEPEIVLCRAYIFKVNRTLYNDYCFHLMMHYYSIYQPSIKRR